MRPQLILLLSSIVSLSSAAQQPDGVIVPFTSVLPACASLCGKLFDVQGACSPPAITTVSTSCFCADSRLTPIIDSGTAGVSTVCGPESCTATADLEAIQSWYATECNLKDPNSATATTTGSASTATGTSSSSTGKKAAVSQTWFQSHWKWVVMLIVIVVAIIGGWVGATFIRRRYLLKKEREIEMKPPIAWGPHQMQGATGGYNYGDGVLASGANKEAKGMVPSQAPLDTGKKEHKGWLRKNRT